jgi:hypothetical protein
MPSVWRTNSCVSTLPLSHFCYNMRMQWQVRFHPEAREEERELPAREKLAMANAIDKLRALGPALPYPHSSDVRGADRLRELRPRAGRSPRRALYRRVGDVMVIAAIAAEAQVDARGFNRAADAAARRLSQLEKDGT